MKLYTVKEIAQMIGVDEQTVYRWIKLSKLKAVKIEGNVRVKEEDLDNFINGK